MEKLLIVPLQHLLQHPLSEEMLKSPFGEWVKSYRYDFDNHTIWGITGRLIKNFVDSFENIRNKMAEMSMTGKSEAN
ncbi:MAG: hypothetical protein Q4A41_04130 [Bacillota bacterium]|nr:hypothetical protein [Bacillota bacterium]